MFRTFLFLSALFILPFIFRYFLAGMLPMVSLILAITVLGRFLD